MRRIARWWRPASSRWGTPRDTSGVHHLRPLVWPGLPLFIELHREPNRPVWLAPPGPRRAARADRAERHRGPGSARAGPGRARGSAGGAQLGARPAPATAGSDRRDGRAGARARPRARARARAAVGARTRVAHDDHGRRCAARERRHGSGAAIWARHLACGARADRARDAPDALGGSGRAGCPARVCARVGGATRIFTTRLVQGETSAGLTRMRRTAAGDRRRAASAVPARPDQGDEELQMTLRLRTDDLEWREIDSDIVVLDGRDADLPDPQWIGRAAVADAGRKRHA